MRDIAETLRHPPAPGNNFCAADYSACLLIYRCQMKSNKLNISGQWTGLLVVLEDGSSGA